MAHDNNAESNKRSQLDDIPSNLKVAKLESIDFDSDPKNRELRKSNIYIFTIDNIERKYFEMQNNPEGIVQIYSDVFYSAVHGYKMKCKVTLDLDNMSIFLKLIKGDYDDLIKWPLSNVQISILHRLDQSKNKVYLLKQKWKKPGEYIEDEDYRFCAVMKTDEMVNQDNFTSEYLHNDYIFIQIKVLNIHSSSPESMKISQRDRDTLDLPTTRLLNKFNLRPEFINCLSNTQFIFTICDVKEKFLRLRANETTQIIEESPEFYTRLYFGYKLKLRVVLSVNDVSVSISVVAGTFDAYLQPILPCCDMALVNQVDSTDNKYSTYECKYSKETVVSAEKSTPLLPIISSEELTNCEEYCSKYLRNNRMYFSVQALQ